MHAVPAAGEQGQEAPRLGLVGRLAQYAAAYADHGIRGQHQGFHRRQRQGLLPRQAGGQPVRLLGLLRCLVDLGRDHLVRHHADARQQFQAARAGGSQDQWELGWPIQASRPCGLPAIGGFIRPIQASRPFGLPAIGGFIRPIQASRPFGLPAIGGFIRPIQASRPFGLPAIGRHALT